MTYFIKLVKIKTKNILYKKNTKLCTQQKLDEKISHTDE